jgi:ribosome-binding protein aMBF1 (putative translation factor)
VQLIIEGKSKGPRGLLSEGCRWTDDAVDFASKDLILDQACRMLWQISRQIRSRRGAMGMNVTKLAEASGVRRQTVRDIQEGITWPDAITLARISSVLGIKLSVTKAE